MRMGEDIVNIIIAYLLMSLMLTNREERLFQQSVDEVDDRGVEKFECFRERCQEGRADLGNGNEGKKDDDA